MKTIATFSLIILGLSIPAFAADNPPTSKPKKTEAKVEKKAKKKAPAKCPICEKAVDPKCTTEYEKKTYAFNSGECRDKWTKQRADSLYQRIGGEPAMEAAITLFYKKVLADKRINGFFEDVDMKRQARKQKAFLSAAFGGPTPWKGKDLRKAHTNVDGLNDSHFDAVAENLQNTLTELKIDEKLIEEVMTIAGSVRDDVLNRKKAPEKDGDKPATKKKKKATDKAAK